MIKLRLCVVSSELSAQKKKAPILTQYVTASLGSCVHIFFALSFLETLQILKNGWLGLIPVAADGFEQGNDWKHFHLLKFIRYKEMNQQRGHQQI